MLPNTGKHEKLSLHMVFHWNKWSITRSVCFIHERLLAFFIHESVWMNFRTQLLSSALSALDLLRSWHMSIFEHVLWSQWVQCHRTLDRSLTLNFKITHNFTILIWQTVSSYLSLIHKPTIFSFTIHTLPCKICGKKIIK